MNKRILRFHMATMTQLVSGKFNMSLFEAYYLLRFGVCILFPEEDVGSLT